MLVKDVMTRDPATISPTAGVLAAVTKLAYVGITSMPVVDDGGRLCGIVSEADLLEDIPDDPRAHERPIVIRPVTPARTVDEVYTRTPCTVRPHDDVNAAVDVMASRGFKSLPVVDDAHRLVGMVSRSDIVRALARDDDAIALDVRRLLTELGHPEWDVEVTMGAATISGPADSGEQSLAHAATRTVPGVMGVSVT